MQSGAQPGLLARNLQQAEQPSGQEDAVEKAFRLAYFIFPDRDTAVQILAGALNKLEIRRERETHRTYWRDKHLKRSITRISRESADILQWLILVESDPYEQKQEEREATREDLVLRYTKFLVRLSTAMSSFHVAIAMQRLLRCYSNAETQRLYEVLTDKYPGSDEYRRAKAVMMERVATRFGKFLSTSRGPHKEIRFEADPN